MAIWVLESAYRYAKASAILLSAHLSYESEVNAALAMELLIKSLLVEAVDNPRRGTVSEQYSTRHIKLKDGHDLIGLYKQVPAEIAEKVGLASQVDLLEKKKDVFKSLRYIYEEKAPRGSDNLLLQTVCWLLPQVVAHFVDTGIEDKWLMYMKANPHLMMVHSIGTC